MFRKLIDSLRVLLQKDQTEREMDAEMRFHLDMLIQENVKHGMSEKQARNAALRSFGGVERTKEECRDARGGRILESLVQDIRFGVRMLLKNPGYTLIAVLTLALGIGANTAIFSVIYGVLIRPLPYHDGNQLVVLQQQAPLASVSNLPFSVKEIEDYRDNNRTLDAVVEHHTMSFILLGRDEAQRVQTGVVSANFFDVLGVKPLLGRTFVPSDEEHGSDAVLVLSYKYWQQSHRGETDVIGKVFQMNNRPHTVVGVLPPIPQYPDEQDIYMPTSHCPTRSSEGFISNRNRRMMSVFARLRAGVTPQESNADLAAIAATLLKDYPDSYPANRGYAISVAALHEELTRTARPTFLILLGTAALVLLIACANVANLNLARLMRREREIAIRAALGAGRGRLIQQLLTESTLLAIVGGLLGLTIAAGTVNLLVKFAERFTPRAGEVTIDLSVLLFTAALSVATGLLFGLVPAFYSQQHLASALKEGAGRASSGTKSQRVRSALVIAQLAISFMLLISAGLMLRSVVKLQDTDPGFNPEGVLVMRVSPNWSKYTLAEQYRGFFTRLVEEIRGQPGVVRAAIASSYPLNEAAIATGPALRSFVIEGRPVPEGELAPRIDFRVVSRDYFDTVRIPLLSGRLFTDADHINAPRVAIINRSAALHRWGEEDPVGRRVSFDNGQTWRTVVGVVGDVRHYGLHREPADELYEPLEQSAFAGFLLVRTASEPMGMVRVMSDIVHRLDPETAVDRVQTLETVRSEAVGSPRLTAILLGLFAGLALVITAAGIAGVMALSVNQRTHELGIRLALGATRWKVLRMVMQQGMALVFVGLAVGIGGALALTGLMKALLYSVEPTDPLTFLAVSLVLMAVAATACFLPARRVTEIDPMMALRSE